MEATLDTGKSQLPLVLRIVKAGIALQAVLDSVDQGASNLPVSTITRDERSLHFEVPAIGARYEGTREDDDSFHGYWSQGANQWPLTWRKTT